MAHYAVTDTTNKFVKRRGGENFASSPDFDSGTETAHTMNAGERLSVGKKAWEHKVVSGAFVELTAGERTTAIAAGAQSDYRFNPPSEATITSGAVTINLSTSDNWIIELTENVTTLTVDTPPKMFAKARLKLKQDSTGSRTFSFTGHTFKNGEAPDMSALGADDWIWLDIISDGTDVTFFVKGDTTGGGGGGALEQFYTHSWDPDSASLRYIPWYNTSEYHVITDNAVQVFLPRAYKLIRIISWNYNTAMGSTTFGLHIDDSTTAQSTVTVDMSAINTPYLFDFSGESNQTTYGEAVAISCDPTTDPAGTMKAVTLWEKV